MCLSEMANRETENTDLHRQARRQKETWLCLCGWVSNEPHGHEVLFRLTVTDIHISPRLKGRKMMAVAWKKMMAHKLTHTRTKYCLFTTENIKLIQIHCMETYHNPKHNHWLTLQVSSTVHVFTLKLNHSCFVCTLSTTSVVRGLVLGCGSFQSGLAGSATDRM